MDNTTVILAEQEFEFAYIPQFGAPANTIIFGVELEAFTLQMDVNYRVTWDGVSYPVQLQDVSSLFGPGYYALGNAAAYDPAFSGNNEPFVIGWTADGILLLAVDGSTAETHTVGIFYGADDEEDSGESEYASNDAIILSYSQNPDIYKDIPKVWLTHPDSTEEAPVLVPFTYGEAVSKTVELDFSGGDMTVPIADGELVTDLTITKPENLLPENIAKDVEIAGIVGELIAGSSNAKISITTTTATDGVFTHGLGVLPDIILMGNQSRYSGSSGIFLTMLMGISAKMKELYPDIPKGTLDYHSGTLHYHVIAGATIEATATNVNYINNANENTFRAARSVLPFAAGRKFIIAIGGLT